MLKKIRENDLFKVLSFMKKRMILYLTSVIIGNAITCVCFNIVIAFITKDVFDAVQKGEKLLIMKACMLAVSTFIIGAIIRPITSYISNLCVKTTMKEIRMKAFNKLEDLNIDIFEKDHSGNFLSIVTNDINNIETIYTNEINMLVFAIMQGCVAVGSMIILEWRLAIVVTVLGIITVFINNCFSKKIRLLNDKLQTQLSKTTERLIDLIQSSTITKMFHLKKKVHGFYMDENNKYLETSINLTKLESLFDAINNFLSSLKFIGVLCLSFFMIYKNYVTAGTAMAVMYLMGNAEFMFDNIGSFIKNVQKSLASSSRVIDLLSMDCESEEGIYLDNLDESFDYLVEFNDVTFSYYNEDKLINPSLKNVNLKLKPNTVIAIVGESGSGKSTIAKLLLSFYKPKLGTINILGMDSKKYSAQDIRKGIAYVPQNPYLFYGTIGENIAYGKIGASKEEIVYAAKMANAHDFIMTLSNGYETMVGERGDNLSGGQKQRIAIARALLRNAPILLLDEATSSLDSESERQIQDALEKVMQDRTTIIIAHRLSTIRKANLIYVLNKGEIVEMGTHDDLLLKGGVYKNLYEIQTKAS